MQKQNIGVSGATVVLMILTAVYMTCVMLVPGDNLEFPTAWTAAAAFVCMVTCLFYGLPSAAWVSFSGLSVACAMMPARYLAYPNLTPDDRFLPIAILVLFGLVVSLQIALATLRRRLETKEPWFLCVIRTTLFVSVIGDLAVLLGSIKPASAINVVPAKA